MSLLSPNLKAFMSITKEGTVHGAASSLGITQTGVTQRIRSLEKEIGTTLFIRSRKGMGLTPEGEALLRYCRNVLELESQNLNTIFRLGEDSAVDISLAGPTSIINARILNQCMALYTQWPNLYLSYIVDDSPDVINLLRSGNTDLAIVKPEQVTKEMDSKLLKPEKYVLVATAQWKGRKLIDVLSNERIIDFNENDLTTINYLKKFELI